jgi:DNA-binding GntR family transcriptional regulator
MKQTKTDYIVNDLISKIYQPKYFMNNKLPTQRDMACAYNVSRYTIQRAMERLEMMGLIESVQGDGIYIHESVLEGPLAFNTLMVPYKNLKSKMLYLKKIPADTELKDIFSIQEGDLIWEFERLRMVNYEIVEVETGWIPCYLFPTLSKSDVEDSIQNMALKHKFKISYFMWNYHTEILSRERAELLGQKKGTPVMSISSRGVLKNGKVFVHSRCLAPSFQCTYIVPFDKKKYLLRRQ